ncbi:DUF1287 domain-containing protein [bacterium]|nr:MAG: DUF1287 domain-containing protein [bacterium]
MVKHVLFFVIVLCNIQLSVAQSAFFRNLADSAFTLTFDHVEYDPTYFSIPYPNGDVPKDKGVCTDVIIRAYRKLGIDLQKNVHEDMAAHFGLYPKIWGLKRTDKHIDHRRVPNLMVFFKRFGIEKPITQNPDDYQAGDIVCWNLSGGITHIGLVSTHKTPDGKRPLIIHNIGGGQEEEDMLFNYTIIGHYSYQN